jgi:hypothetical protein
VTSLRAFADESDGAHLGEHSELHETLSVHRLTPVVRGLRDRKPWVILYKEQATNQHREELRVREELALQRDCGQQPPPESAVSSLQNK